MPFYHQIEPFLQRFHDPTYPYDPIDIRGHFASSPGAPTDLYGSADVVYILWILGELDDRTTAEGRAEWADVIRSYQDPATGRFDLCQECLLESATHATAFSVAALKLLGSTPLYPLTWVEDIFASPASIDDWLAGFNWNIIWEGSHEMGAAAALIDAPYGATVPETWGSWTLAALDSLVDTNTGFWKLGIFDKVFKCPTTNDLGGAAHFWWIYERLGQPIPRPGQAIESILAVQYPSGLWGNRLFGGKFPQGIDFDALNGYRLALASLDESTRASYEPAILASIQRYACVTDTYLNPAGAVDSRFETPHKLVGTLNAMAELNMLHEALTAAPAMTTPRPWRSALTAVAWQ